METSMFPPYAFECFLCLVASVLLYHLAYSPFSYWKKRGVPQMDAQLPFVGDMIKHVLTPPHEARQWGYHEFPQERFVGMYDIRTPLLLIRDPDLMQSILIKDFSYMSSRSTQDDPNAKMAKNLVNMNGDQWKQYRIKLAPTFSSGKLKGMHSQLTDCAQSLLKHIEQFDDGQPFEIRKSIEGYATDVIASVAFGLNADSINDPDSEFRKAGMEFFKPTLWFKIIFVTRTRPLLRMLSKFTGLLINKTQWDVVGSFFSDVIDKTIEYRKNNKNSRQDFLQLMYEVMEKDKADPNVPFPFDHNALISNAFIFFLGGFETSATTICFAMYQLALNEDIQEKAYEEVSAVLKKHGGEATFNACQEMEYLDQVISETLRIYPPFVNVSRKAVKPYQLPGTNLVIPEGMVVNLPIYALHHDPQFFPEPEKFIPERFDESKNTIRKGTYLPFGGGPRICIGARFAKIVVSVCLATLMNKYKFVKCSETKVPLEFDERTFILVPKDGILLALKPRAATTL